MIRPILACEDPYRAAETFVSAGWKLDFSQPPESGDPLVGVSLFDNAILLGIADGYVANEEKKHLGCGVEIYLTVPSKRMEEVHKNHSGLNAAKIELQPWGVYAFEVSIENYRFMIAAE